MARRTVEKAATIQPKLVAPCLQAQVSVELEPSRLQTRQVHCVTEMRPGQVTEHHEEMADTCPFRFDAAIAQKTMPHTRKWLERQEQCSTSALDA